MKRVISQISSLNSAAARGGPEYPSRPLVRGGETTTPCVHHRSVRVHVRGRDLGSQLWTGMSRGVRRYSIGGGILFGGHTERSIIGVPLMSWRSLSISCV